MKCSHRPRTILCELKIWPVSWPRSEIWDHVGAVGEADRDATGATDAQRSALAASQHTSPFFGRGSEYPTSGNSDDIMPA